MRFRFLIATIFSLSTSSATVWAQQAPIVQPGAPGQPTRVLAADTRPVLPATSPKDVEFMQGMIMHHGQAVEMTAMIESRTENKELRLLGARISHSQAEEMRFMERWLVARGRSTEMQMPKKAHSHHDMSMPGMKMSDGPMLMPGMLTADQMETLESATGAEFDQLFLKGMIQHHAGALVMVKDLFDTSGAGQDGEIFGFATDVDSGQRAEIRIMQDMLGQRP